MFVALFVLAPGVIASLIFCGLSRIPVKTVAFFLYALVFAFLICVFSFGIIVLRGWGASSPEEVFSNLQTMVKYGGLSLVAAVAFPGIAHMAYRLVGGKKDER